MRPPCALKVSSPGRLSVWGSLNWPVHTATKSKSSLTGAAVRPAQIEPPARRGIGPAIHLRHGRVETDRAEKIIVLGVFSQIGVDLRPLRPFRIGIRHRLVGVTIEILRALRLHLGIGPRRLPDPAEIAAALDNRDLMSARGEGFCGREPRYTGADDTNLFLPDHDNSPAGIGPRTEGSTRCDFRRSCPAVAGLFVGLGRQKVHLVLRRDPDHLFGIRQIVKLVEQRFELLHRRHPEQRARRLV